jgi:hypothetical protein
MSTTQEITNTQTTSPETTTSSNTSSVLPGEKPVQNKPTSPVKNTSQAQTVKAQPIAGKDKNKSIMNIFRSKVIHSIKKKQGRSFRRTFFYDFITV